MKTKTDPYRPETVHLAGLIDGEVDGPRVCYCLDREAFAKLSEQIPAFLDSLTTSNTCC